MHDMLKQIEHQPEYEQWMEIDIGVVFLILNYNRNACQIFANIENNVSKPQAKHRCGMMKLFHGTVSPTESLQQCDFQALTHNNKQEPFWPDFFTFVKHQNSI